MHACMYRHVCVYKIYIQDIPQKLWDKLRMFFMSHLDSEKLYQHMSGYQPLHRYQHGNVSRCRPTMYETVRFQYPWHTFTFTRTSDKHYCPVALFWCAQNCACRTRHAILNNNQSNTTNSRRSFFPVWGISTDFSRFLTWLYRHN